LKNFTLWPTKKLEQYQPTPKLGRENHYQN